MPSVSSLDEAAATLAAAHAEGRQVRIGDDLTAAGLNRILEHDPGDLTCTVEAGVRLSELRAALAATGQRLSLDPPGDPTIGALLAQNLSGPLRHRFGAPRDLVLGATLVLADGTIANAGGKVVKNVAGYDLARLMCGSEGRFAFIVRASFKLHPLPKATGTLVVDTDEAAAVAAWLLRSQVQPSALDVLHPGRVAVLFEGSERAVAAQLAAAQASVGGEEADAAVWEESRERQAAARGRLRFVPGDLAATLAGAGRSRRQTGVRRRVRSRAHGRRAERVDLTSVRRDPRAARSTGSPRRVIREYTSDCVHCGFCLPTCPTYVLWSEEMDSPRGRIHLMDARLDGTIALNATVAQHFDRCLGCMACLSSCPSGVRYDRLIESTRAAVEEELDRSLSDRFVRGLLFRLLPHPGRMRAALRLAPLGRVAPMPKRFRPLVDIAPRWRGRGHVPALTPASGTPRARVGLLTGCVQSAVFPDVNAATARVLAADGFEVVAPPQGCCGALSVHAGRLDEGKAFARRLLDAFADVDLVVVNTSGCGSHLKELGWLLGDERAEAFASRVRDVGELLGETTPRAARHPLPMKVALQDSCHLRHAQRLPLSSRTSLGRIPGLDVVEPAEQDLCCGSAGIYNVTQPEAARELGERKAAHVLATGAQAYASANPGCLVQISNALARAKAPLPALHPVELVDASIRNVGTGSLLAAARR